MVSVAPLKKKVSFSIKTSDHKRLYVWPLVGKRIVHDQYGHVYLARWKKDLQNKNTSSRTKKKWSQSEVIYIRFADGVIDLERGLLQALAGGSECIMEYGEIQFILETIQGKLEDVQSLDQPLTKQIKKSLLDITESLSGATATPTQEAVDQLKWCVTFKDSRGRLNLGVIRCRLSTVDERIRERLETLNAWSKRFHEDLYSLYEIKDNFFAFVKRLRISLKRDMDMIGNFSKINFNQKRFLRGKVEIYINNIVPWIHIEPFSKWALLVHDDLNSILTRLDLLRPDLIGDFYQTLLSSIECKLIQLEIFQFIDYITNDLKIVQHSYGITLTQESLDEMVRYYDVIVTRLATVDVNGMRYKTPTLVLTAMDELLKKRECNPYGPQETPFEPKVLMRFKDGLKEISRLF